MSLINGVDEVKDLSLKNEISLMVSFELKIKHLELNDSKRLVIP